MAILNSVPMRWPSGPLEIAKRRRTESVTPEVKQAIDYWHNPPALDILQGTSVNCLVVNWASGLAEDTEQQRTIRPLVDAARQRNLDVVGWVDGQTDGKAAIAAAQSAGLSAVAIQGFSGKSDFPVIPWGDRAHVPWDTGAAVLPISDNLWPGVQARTASANAGPTALPWLDSNGWFIKLAHARTQAQVWVLFDPPGKGNIVPARSYPTAVCDAEAAGGRWVISLDDDLRGGLAQKNTTAAATWKSLSDTVAFFDRHREWKQYRLLGGVGVMSDFAGDNYDFSGEILNALSRRDLLFRVLYSAGKSAPDLAGLKAVTWADSAQPAAPLRKSMLTFVEQGGLLITGPKWGAEGKSVPSAHERYDVRTLGKGRLAVAKADTGDAWSFVTDMQELLSHANDYAKLFNASASGGMNYSGTRDGKRALLQLVSYASYGRSNMGGAAVSPSSLATAWTRDKYRTAKVWTIDSAQPTAVEVAACEDGGTEYHLPPIPAYMALDFEV
jgi:hypothetical protein